LISQRCRSEIRAARGEWVNARAEKERLGEELERIEAVIGDEVGTEYERVGQVRRPRVARKVVVGVMGGVRGLGIQ
jgi:hypothetical protein